MKTLVRHSFPLAGLTLIFTLIPQLSTLFAQGTAFTYQGRVTESSSPYTGSAEFQPTLWDAVSGGSAVATNNPARLIVGVTNGLFVLPLDFGGAPFAAGDERWLQLEMRTSIGAFTTLAPRQKLAPTPYAMTAGNLGGTLPAGQLTGTLPSGQLGGTYSGALAFSNAGNSFSGSGAGLTALNASQLTSGTVPNARLGANVARTSQVWLLDGNAGTKPGADFLGTTDEQPLELRINGLRAFRLEPTGDGSDSFTIPDGAPNVVAGSPWNAAAAGTVGATISGGGATNYAGHAYTNAVLADYGTIGGGVGNRIGAGSVAATVGGGFLNDIGHNSPRGAIAGGDNNRIADNSYGGTIAGGLGNDIGTNSNYGAIAGGYNNDIPNNAGYATIPGGLNNTATNYAFAAGRRAKALHEGAFVWADSLNADFSSTAKQQFLIRAGGGVGINKSDPATALDVNGTVTATAFSGSADGSPLVLRAADQTVLRLEGEASGTRIIGGRGNTLDSGSTNSAILSGRDNTITNAAHESVIVGGAYNKIRTDQRSSFIGGGVGNEIRQDNRHAVIVGGFYNRIVTNSLFTSILGGNENHFGDNVNGGLIVGGSRNDIEGSDDPNRLQLGPLIVGGSDHGIGKSSSFAVIVGGAGNRIGTNSQSALIVGGGGSYSPNLPNRIRDNSAAATVVGGSRNIVSSDSPYSFVGGGYHNEIQTNAAYATIAEGYYNEVLEGAEYAIIPGGAPESSRQLCLCRRPQRPSHQPGRVCVGGFQRL